MVPKTLTVACYPISKAFILEWKKSLILILHHKSQMKIIAHLGLLANTLSFLLYKDYNSGVKLDHCFWANLFWYYCVLFTETRNCEHFFLCLCLCSGLNLYCHKIEKNHSPAYSPKISAIYQEDWPQGSSYTKVCLVLYYYDYGINKHHNPSY